MEPDKEICKAETGKGTRCTRPAKEDGLCEIHLRVRDKETAPWEAGENPWAADKMKLAGKHEGFRPRFVPPHKVNNKKTEGWIVADGKHYNEPTSDGSVVKRNEMILMEIPEGLAKQREAHFQKVTKERSRGAREIMAAQNLKNQVRLEDTEHNRAR